MGLRRVDANMKAVLLPIDIEYIERKASTYLYSFSDLQATSYFHRIHGFRVAQCCAEDTLLNLAS
jgi:hypothetical protein